MCLVLPTSHIISTLVLFGMMQHFLACAKEMGLRHLLAGEVLSSKTATSTFKREVCIVTQTFLPVDSVCIGCPTTSSAVCNLFTRECFSKKYQTGKNLLDQILSLKHPHSTIRSTQHLTPVSRATSKWLIKICGTWLVIKKLYCFLPITVLYSLIIELYFLVFALCLLINCLQSLIFP